jgi:tripartite-type tricarboxylate transporter receptor subunit TctC
MLISRRFLATALALAWLPATGASADDTSKEAVAKFFAGKTIQIMVGATAGGSYDVASRLVASHMPRHIPGSPAMVIANMPGAAGLIMMNNLYNVAPQDGTAMGMPNSSMFLEPQLKLLAQSGNVQFDLNKYNWVGNLVQDVQVFWGFTSSGVKKFEDLKTKKLIVGATAPGGDLYTLPLLMKSVLGAKIELVAGYAGTPELFIAADRGEIEGAVNARTNIFTSRPSWLKEGKAAILVQYGVERHPTLRDVPTAVELMTTEEDRQMFRFYARKFQLARTLILPPNVPAERVGALQTAFDATMKDAALLEQATKSGIDIEPLTGKQVADAIEGIQSTPPKVIDRLRSMINEPDKK